MSIAARYWLFIDAAYRVGAGSPLAPLYLSAAESVMPDYPEWARG